MSIARAARRRRKQFAQGFTHMAKLSPHNGCSRPLYKRKALHSISEAIAKERQQAALERARKAGKR